MDGTGPDTKNFNVVEQIKQAYSLKEVSNEVLNEALSGFTEGRDWTLRRYGSVDSPRLHIGSHTGNLKGINGYTETTDGAKIIALQVEELKKLAAVRNIKKASITDDYGRDIPIRPELTIRQWYEGFGIEETLHWLQDNRTEGLSSLPPNNERLRPESGAGIRYLRQPHEFEALVIRGEFYKQKYGNNPLEQLQEFVKNQST